MSTRLSTRPRTSSDDPSPDVSAGRLVRWARGGALAFEFTGTITAGALCGWALDSWLGTEPWALVVLMLAGVVGGFGRLIHLVRRFERLDRGER